MAYIRECRDGHPANLEDKMKTIKHDNESIGYSHAIIISKTGTIVSTGDLSRCKRMISFHGSECEIVKLV